ncbi:M23 family metallopeptidase [Anaerotruncus massiliensis (ex Liu et al. 2021)]|uniref:M23 family metallopeptidase n=2 Tax=Anaerotruncus TaxID=244127 RepID=A0A498D0D3_9FIRM|nr:MULTISPECIES: M23 family metallopeptidase [Anaerotruncus]MBC3938159.1 M23 family metallopeptidase [Anaerotruncus massiliensis (ex Togo et al. 2019)]RLL13195.1 M23 family metallopeptidase [Anaerotruncus massiliensis (ex Liu et al. 2021)]
MSQKLILPINQALLTASMKTQAYLDKFHFVHYGVDMVSSRGDRTVYASGEGTVLETGVDSVVGNVVAVLYPGAQCRNGRSGDLIFRYFHLERILVKKGDAICKDTRIGCYGNTGSLKMAPHLHLEADSDTAHPLFSPTVLRSSFLHGRSMGANDATVCNPIDWLACKQSPPDSQSYRTAGDVYIRPEDLKIEMA